MKELVFATSNPHKASEVAELLGDAFSVRSLLDIGCTEEIPETSPTIAGNALQKARYVHEHYGLDCFAEDTGLEIDALNGAPGVLTARFAGPARDPEANMALVLRKLQGEADRSARFRTVVALIIDGTEYTFEGIANGRIARQKTGSGGFGYDPIFIPEGYQHSFAEMPQEEKNRISHRGHAIRKLIEFLRSGNGKLLNH